MNQPVVRGNAPAADLVHLACQDKDRERDPVGGEDPEHPPLHECAVTRCRQLAEVRDSERTIEQEPRDDEEDRDADIEPLKRAVPVAGRQTRFAREVNTEHGQGRDRRNPSKHGKTARTRTREEPASPPLTIRQ